MNSSYQHIADFAVDPSFQRYALGTSSKETEFWLKYLQENPHQAEMMEKAAELVRGLSISLLEPDLEKMAQVRKSLKAHILASESQPKSRRLIFQRWLLVASVLLFALIGGWWLGRKDTETEFKTGFGESMQFALKDGSQVILNANSTLRVPQEWDSIREVWLDGEAYFNITSQQTGKRFVVHAEPVDVEVLGTSFNVRRRGDIADVVLAEGHVSLRTPMDTVDMQPGDRVVVEKGEAPSKTTNVGVEVLTAWREGKMAFDNTPLSEVADRMEEVFGVEVYVDPELVDRRLTGRLGTENLDLLILALSETFDLNIETRKDSIKITR